MARLCLCLLMLLTIVARGAENAEIAARGWGRLFTTHAERARLEALRAAGEGVSPATSIVAGAELETANESPISVQGYIKPADGSNGTVWVNGAPIQENSADGSIAIDALQANQGRVRIKLDGGKFIDLKAGQAYLPVVGNIVDLPVASEGFGKAGRSNNRQPGLEAGQ